MPTTSSCVRRGWILLLLVAAPAARPNESFASQRATTAAASTAGVPNAFSSHARAAGPLQFAPDDRWIALGDSITHGSNVRVYHQWVELFYLTRFPDQSFVVGNAGISGDTADGTLARLSWDVLQRRPTVVTVMFGMNDIGRTLYEPKRQPEDVEKQREERIERYERNTRELVQRLLDARIRVILITPTPYDDTSSGPVVGAKGCNAALAECARRARAIATDAGTGLLDFHEPLTRYNTGRQALDAAFSIVGTDRVHPGAAGHFLAAYYFLRQQGAEPLVSRVVLTGDTGQVEVADRCRVTAIHVAPDQSALSFTLHEEALPYPVDEQARPALAWCAFEDEFNQQSLTVNRLRPGRYALTIGETQVGEYTAAELERGINLATNPRTPQYVQAVAAAKLLADKHAFEAAQRAIPLMEKTAAADLPRPLPPEVGARYVADRLAQQRGKSAEAFFTRMADVYAQAKPLEADAVQRVADLVAAARRAARPRPHAYKLERVSDR